MNKWKCFNQEVRRGDVELWRVTSDGMAHPFHIHGTSFQVLVLEDGRWTMC